VLTVADAVMVAMAIYGNRPVLGGMVETVGRVLENDGGNGSLIATDKYGRHHQC